MDLLCSCRVDPVRQSPRTKMYGYFTHGTDPPPRPCSSGFLSVSNRLRLPPSPAHFRRRLLGCTAFDCASDTVRQSDYWQSVALSTPVENSSFCRLKIPQSWSSGGLQFRLVDGTLNPAGEAEAGTAGVQPVEE